jgi:HSP20 family molecular chaperone IbpA
MLVRTRPLTFDPRFDRAFNQLTSSFFTPTRRAPVVDAAWRDDSLELTVDLPGVPQDAIDVSVAHRTLTVSARAEGLEWERSIRLGVALDPESVTARYENGRLTVTVGATPKPEARRIEIATEATEADEAELPAGDQPAGEVSSTE